MGADTFEFMERNMIELVKGILAIILFVLVAAIAVLGVLFFAIYALAVFISDTFTNSRKWF